MVDLTDPNVELSYADSMDKFLHLLDIRLGNANIEMEPHECSNPEHSKTKFSQVGLLILDYTDMNVEEPEIQHLSFMVDPATPAYELLMSGLLTEKFREFQE